MHVLRNIELNNGLVDNKPIIPALLAMSQQNLINTLFRPEVLAMSSYHVADATGLVKLDAMENPYTWPDSLKQQWLEILKDCALNRYPDPEAKSLKQIIRSGNHIADEWEILLGNGSDEIIQLLLMALPTGASVLSPAPGFVMYKQLSDCLGLNYIGVPLLANFDLDLPAMLAAIEQHRPSVIFIAYPNNPTGNLFSGAAIKDIIAAAQGWVVIDEAYAPFAGASFIGQIGQYSNVMVMRTVSKLGLAGLRLGYLVGHPAVIEQLNKIRLPYNINILTQASAEFALRNSAVFDQQTQAICADRTKMLEALNAMDGITAYPSQANFILFRTPKDRANAIFAAIKQQGVLIKNMNPQGGLLADCLRVTVGRPEENALFLAALKKSL